MPKREQSTKLLKKPAIRHRTSGHLSNNKRRPWTSVEDEYITKLVEIYGTKHWTHVAEQFNKHFPKHPRNGK